MLPHQEEGQLHWQRMRPNSSRKVQELLRLNPLQLLH